MVILECGWLQFHNLDVACHFDIKRGCGNIRSIPYVIFMRLVISKPLQRKCSLRMPSKLDLMQVCFVSRASALMGRCQISVSKFL